VVFESVVYLAKVIGVIHHLALIKEYGTIYLICKSHLEVRIPLAQLVNYHQIQLWIDRSVNIIEPISHPLGLAERMRREKLERASLIELLLYIGRF
jgi:hypothetical protein